jgi:AcrR family transcriptional regulator
MSVNKGEAQERSGPTAISVQASRTARQAASAGRRLPREERERLIVAEAIRFFADVGFGGDTRELAKRRGVSHPLLFRHFPSKEALIEKVCEQVYFDRWDPRWEELIADTAIPLRARMARFYTQFAGTIINYEWIRLAMYAGLRGIDLDQRLLAHVDERIVQPICRELRREFGLPERKSTRFPESERELVWGLNAKIVHLGIRTYIYGMPLPRNLDKIIESEIDAFFDGIRPVLRKMVAERQRAPSTPRLASAACAISKSCITRR